MIPAQAVEAAAMTLCEQMWENAHERQREYAREEARAALEAAAPYMLAGAWEQGKNAVWSFMSNQDPLRERPSNPYMLNNEGEK